MGGNQHPKRHNIDSNRKVSVELLKLIEQSEKGFEVNTLKSMHIFKKQKKKKTLKTEVKVFPHNLNSGYKSLFILCNQLFQTQ